MSDLDIFKGNALVGGDLFNSLLDMNKTMTGGTGGGNRISIRGGKFRLIVGGEQVSVSKEDTMNFVVLNAAEMARTYYEGSFDPENPAPPACWSANTREPAPEVPEETRQAARCADCPMNIKGSGQGESRACRFSQRLAVALEGDLETVYQLQLPATSIFGDSKGNDMGLQAYMKFLTAHKTPAIAVMTEMRFDEDANTPKLFFKPARALEEDELKAAIAIRDSEEAVKAITFTVAQTDGVSAKGKADKKEAEPKKEKPKALAKPDVEEKDDEVAEPEKVSTKKSTPEVSEKTSDKLADVLGEWDD